MADNTLSPYLTPPPTIPSTRFHSPQTALLPMFTMQPTLTAPHPIQLYPTFPHFSNPLPPISQFVQPLSPNIITSHRPEDEDLGEPVSSPNTSRSDKRRRTGRATGGSNKGDNTMSFSTALSPNPSGGGAGGPHSAGGSSPGPISGPTPTTSSSNGNTNGNANGGTTNQHLFPPQNSLVNPGMNRGRPGIPAPLKPTIGFAAGREARRESGNGNTAGGGNAGGNGDFEHPIPSPVVMGFDFKSIDDDQLKTVRDTISIKEQQQALIAARRRELAASTPNTPKELTFKGWQPKEPMNEKVAPGSGSGSGGVGRRREKTRDKVERMSIVTGSGGGGEKDIVPGSKSAPLNQGLSAQQATNREHPPSGSQTAIPPNIHPPSGYPSNGMDLRTAPMSHTRVRTDEHDLGRRGGPPYYRRYEPVPSHPHGSAMGGSGSGSEHRRNFTVPANSASRYDPGMPPPSASASGPPRSYGSDSASPPEHHLPPSHSHGGPLSFPPHSHDSRDRERDSHREIHFPPHHTHDSHRDRDRDPRNGGGPLPPLNSATLQGEGRSDFLQPFNQLYDLLHQAEKKTHSLGDLLHRYESSFQNHTTLYNEFKHTTSQANALLGSLQQSADNLKEMVRYEVGKAVGPTMVENQELKERIRFLEIHLGVSKDGPVATNSTSSGGVGKQKEKEKEKESSIPVKSGPATKKARTVSGKVTTSNATAKKAATTAGNTPTKPKKVRGPAAASASASGSKRKHQEVEEEDDDEEEEGHDKGEEEVDQLDEEAEEEEDELDEEEEEHVAGASGASSKVGKEAVKALAT